MVSNHIPGENLLQFKKEKPTAFVVFGVLVASIAHAQQPTTPATLFKRLSPSVFAVEVLNGSGSVVAIGSGVAVAPDQVVTNRHVIEAGRAWRVRQGDKTWPATVTHVDPDHDLAQLKVDGLKAPPVPLRASSTLSVGERVYAIGAPEGLEQTLSEGLISGLREYEKVRLIQTSTAISPGSSGGGLFDGQGRLVGITTFFLSEGQNLNFALPVEWVQGLARQRLLASIAHAQRPTNQQQSAGAYKEVFFRAAAAASNLGEFQWLRHAEDPTYIEPGTWDVASDGNVKCISDAKSRDCFDNLSLWRQAFSWMLQLRAEIRAAQPSRNALEAGFLDQARSAWSDFVDVYCQEAPGVSYTDLEGKIRACPNGHDGPSGGKVNNDR